MPGMRERPNSGRLKRQLMFSENIAITMIFMMTVRVMRGFPRIMNRSQVQIDIDGKNQKIYPNKKEEAYEEMLDNAGTESQLGDIPYRRKDNYI
ncbi:hypothetical protein [Mesobacillus zeae]|uniref:Uncharacterized protein n=1 Tax=Mesobacillus zeae TaxID=1917180 RepID=A0A398B4Y4_9BACI|nr:hypothetical protein [Mesobacillus zeae]RID83020.1 hypothetical protein D1970_15970 [Mesobacillus zeae]